MKSEDNEYRKGFNLDWVRNIAERRIADAIEEGKFDNLPGRGEPIVFEDDPHTPAHLRIPHQIMKNAGVVPGWVSAEQEIENSKASADAFRMKVAAAPPNEPGEIIVLRAEYEKMLRESNNLILKYNVVNSFVYRAPIPFRIKDRLAQWDAEIGSGQPKMAAEAEAAPAP